MRELKMSRLDKLKKFLDDNYKNYQYCGKAQTFFCGNITGDPMEEVYDEDEIVVLECFNYGYIEILGLTDDEQENIRKYGYNEH